MPNPQQAEIDGWKIRAWGPYGARIKYHVEAREPTWGKFAEAYGTTLTEAIERVAEKTGIERQELLATFGL